MIYRTKPPTGVSGVGEHVEICIGTQDILMFLQGLKYLQHKCDNEAAEKNMRKSESAILAMKQGNSWGAKGWQIDRA